VQAIAKDRIHMMKTTIQELRDENMLLLSQPRAEEPPEDEDEEEEEEDEELPGTTGDPFKDALLVGLSPKKQKEKLRVHAAVLSGMGAEEKLVKILQDKQKVEKFFEEAFESSAWSVGGLKPNKWGPILQIENEREQMREERIGHRTQLLAEQNKARMLERRIAELESAGAKPNNIASPPDLYDIASPAPPNEQVAASPGPPPSSPMRPCPLPGTTGADPTAVQPTATATEGMEVYDLSSPAPPLQPVGSPAQGAVPRGRDHLVPESTADWNAGSLLSQTSSPVSPPRRGYEPPKTFEQTQDLSGRNASSPIWPSGFTSPYDRRPPHADGSRASMMSPEDNFRPAWGTVS